MDENLLALIDFAIREEEGAKALYARGAELTSDILAGQLLVGLAEIEGEHAERLRHLRDHHGPSACLTAGPAVKAADYELADAPGAGSSIAQILDYAIRAEDRSHQLYSALASRCSLPEGRDLFTGLAKEELQHKAHLQRVQAASRH